MKPTVGIVVALPAEARALVGKARWRPLNVDGQVQHIKEGENLTLVFVQAGIGAERSLSAAKWLVGNGAKLLASVGVVGGLSPEVNTGDIIIAERIVEHDNEKETKRWSSNPTYAAAVREAISRAGVSVRSGDLATSREPILTVAQKKDLYQQTQALAVDMESSAVASIAKEAGLPFLAMRAVSDNANTSVPQDIYKCLRKNGTVRLFLLFAKILQRPGLLADLTRLKRDFDTALFALAKGWHAQVSSVLPDLLARHHP